jgi:hypothetical protein
MRFLAYFTLALIAGQARAETPPPPSMGAVPAPAQPPAPPTPNHWPPPGVYDYGAAAPPFADQSVPAQALLAYDRNCKNPTLAVLLSLLWPGLGNAYAGHGAGVFITWALILGGTAVAIHGLDASTGNSAGSGCGEISNEFYLGLALGLAGIAYSPIDAYLAADDYNRELGARLGLPPGFAVVATPIKVERGVAWGPSVSLRF